MNPEASWEEYKTSQFIRSELDKLGIPYVAIAKTGIVATITGDQPGKTVALRADMDALRVSELNDAPYKSKVEGLMHACGHDGHTAMLLGAAKALTEMKDSIKGRRKIAVPACRRNGSRGKADDI